jgi:hypothetical protein
MSSQAAAQPKPVPQVHWHEHDPSSRRAAPATASPIGEPGLPRAVHGSAAELEAIIDWLQVETSRRYRRRPGVTFCNVYAADVAYAAGAYLPRVWWTAAALRDLRAGAKVTPRYAATVMEMNANQLHDWLEQWGPAFGWRRAGTTAELQEAANHGRAAVICARRSDPSRSGHIAVAAPESARFRALRNAAGHIVRPLMSQAGSVNYRRAVPPRPWWRGAQFSHFGFFVHG